MLSTASFTCAAMMSVLAPASAYAAYVVSESNSQFGDDPVDKVVNLGIGGLILVIVVIPLLRWVLRRLDMHADQNERLLQTLIDSQRTNSEAVDAFGRFEAAEEVAHRSVVNSVNSMTEHITVIAEHQRTISSTLERIANRMDSVESKIHKQTETKR